jgi:hypothetical protein
LILDTSGPGTTQWPARLAYTAALIFAAASIATNAAYGWTRGGDLPSALIWAGVSIAAGITQVLSWPALVTTIDRRQWGKAIASVFALTICASYSITAALGSAAGSRYNAASAEQSAADTRKRAQAGYDAAQAELAKIEPSRSVAELLPLVEAAKPQCRVRVDSTGRQTVCAKPSGLLAELGRAHRRAELQDKVDKANAVLNATSARQANSDTHALKRYVNAVGLQVSAERLNDLLTLLAVLVIESAGGLALVIALALSEKPLSNQCVQTTPAHSTGQRIKETSAGSEEADSAHTVHSPAQSTRDRLIALVRDANGALHTGHRALGEALGVSATRVGQLLRDLAGEGAIRVRAGKTGSVITLVPKLVGAC